ncbi:hypothetical protein KC19_8G121400 [Ceratodon purpureus]|uniref:Uncharacterized protein n=1 Tax=Ceratodon purpureus TaxID=3225 RepID=A0A8T0H188_CERPU|nr:hypothetical protein KC19_8G121400 [Ceratodon purpureus]
MRTLPSAGEEHTAASQRHFLHLCNRFQAARAEFVQASAHCLVHQELRWCWRGLRTPPSSCHKTSRFLHCMDQVIWLQTYPPQKRRRRNLNPNHPKIGKAIERNPPQQTLP